MTTVANIVLRDIAANRPAAGIAGRLFYDTTNNKMQRDNGSTWDDVEPAGAGSPLSTKGDVYVYSTTNARLAVGADGTRLVADSGQTTGLKWQAPERLVVNITGATNYTTASTTFVDIDSTNLTVTTATPTGGRRYLITLQARIAHSTAGATSAFDFTVDATRVVSASTSGSGVRLITINNANKSYEVSIAYVSASLAAGAHTIRPQWRTSGATLTAVCATDELLQFAVIEL